MRKRLLWGGAGLLFAFQACLVTLSVHAQEVVRGRGLVCDTALQIKKAIAAFDRGENGVAEVNREEPRACGILAIEYYLREILEKLPTKEGLVDLARVDIVAIFDGIQWRRLASHQQIIAIQHESGKASPRPNSSGIVEF